MTTIVRDAGLSGLIAGEIEAIASGFIFTEGPLWLPDGSLLFQDIKAERTYCRDASGVVRVLRERTGAANGQTFDSRGDVIFCEQNRRRISRMAPDGSRVAAVIDNWEGKRLNSPNDVICRSDGLVYFTDPPYGLKSPADRELPFQAVFALMPDGAIRPVVWEGFEKPNGLALSPDERTLYVCDTARYHVRAFQVEPSGDLAPGTDRVFATFDPGVPGGPDGMKVDCDGRVYVAVALGIWVYERDGSLLGILGLPERPSNLAWCEPDSQALAITAVDKVYRVRLRVRGCPPACQPRG